jgi:hypothetical protein
VTVLPTGAICHTQAPVPIKLAVSTLVTTLGIMSGVAVVKLLPLVTMLANVINTITLLPSVSVLVTNANTLML